jgi:magnesium transporter
MAGVLPETDHDYLEQKLLGISWRRGAPLLVLLCGQFLAGGVISGYTLELKEMIALACFIPMVMAMGGSVGVQTAMLTVRGLSTGEIHLSDFWKVLVRELTVCLLLGVTFAVLAACLAYGLLEWGTTGGSSITPAQLGLTLSITMFLVMLLSVTTGVIMPMLFQAMKLDPAFMTSPFLTTTVDIVGLLIYFNVARIVLGL